MSWVFESSDSVEIVNIFPPLTQAQFEPETKIVKPCSRMIE